MSEHTVSPSHIGRPPGSMETVEERREEPGQDYPSGADVGHIPVTPVQTEDDAVLVRVVGTPAPPETDVEWEAYPAFVENRSVEIAGANRNRMRLFIRNGNAAGGDSVYLTPLGSTPREFGYVLEAQDAVEMFHNRAVWARTASGDSATLSVFVEYVVE